jgi:ArsR family transcriptional regulator, arsenate/arsenite/antimonite-responsive transcriptional repressor
MNVDALAQLASWIDFCQYRLMSIQTGEPMTEPQACCSPLVTQAMDSAEAEDLSRLLKALADPVRLRLLSMIGAASGGEVCVCDLTDAFELTQPTISHHLKVLREAGLIASDRRGTWVYYRLLPAAMDRLAGLFTPKVAA